MIGLSLYYAYSHIPYAQMRSDDRVKNELITQYLAKLAPDGRIWVWRRFIDLEVAEPPALVT